MKPVTRTIEIWETKGGFKERITWNPCNCHPNNVMREFGPRFKKAVCYVGQNKSTFTKRLKSRGYVRISREVVKLK